MKLITIGQRPVLQFENRSKTFKDWQEVVDYINRTGLWVELPEEMPKFFKEQIVISPLLHEAHAVQLTHNQLS